MQGRRRHQLHVEWLKLANKKKCSCAHGMDWWAGGGSGWRAEGVCDSILKHVREDKLWKLSLDTIAEFNIAASPATSIHLLLRVLWAFVGWYSTKTQGRVELVHGDTKKENCGRWGQNLWRNSSCRAFLEYHYWMVGIDRPRQPGECEDPGSTNFVQLCEYNGPKDPGSSATVAPLLLWDPSFALHCTPWDRFYVPYSVLQVDSAWVGGGDSREWVV